MSLIGQHRVTALGGRPADATPLRTHTNSSFASPDPNISNMSSSGAPKFLFHSSPLESKHADDQHLAPVAPPPSGIISFAQSKDSLQLRIYGFTNIKQRQLAIHNVRRIAPQVGDVRLPQRSSMFQLSQESRDELSGGNWFDIECPDFITAQQVLSLNATVLSSSNIEPFMIGVHRIVSRVSV